MAGQHRRAARHQAVESGNNCRFAVRFDAAGRFVEQQDRGIGQKRAGDADALFLPSAESHAALVVLGRAVPVIAARADVVWFEFSVICASARSQNDYVELAQEFRTVMIGHVPLFEAPEQDDAARRFIALVDEFYDQGTKLGVSAAAPPFELYRRGRLQSEFERTASRLVEMQSLGYLARARRG